MRTPQTAAPELLQSPTSTTTSGLFYGWIILALSFTVLCVAYGIQFTFGVFMTAIEADTGWDRTSLSVPYSVYVFVYSALGAVTGWSTDRWGPRIVIFIGGCLLGSGILLTSQIQAPWHLYVTLGIVAALGMSAAFVPCNATVVRWFIRRRGLALSIASSGGSAGNFIFPPLAAALIAAYGWRSSYLILGCLGLTVITLCALFMVRDPEQVGLQPDGHPALPPAQDGPATHVETGLELTLAQAQRTVSLWMLTAVYTMTWLVIFMPFVHIVPFAIGLGVSPVQAATIISVIGIGSLAGRLIAGTLSDQLGRLPTLGLCLFFQALAFLGFYFSTGLNWLYPSAIIFGFSYGGATALFPAITGDFFGRISVGAIVGFIFGVAGSTAAFGPFIAGYIYDVTGSYGSAFLLSVGLNLVGIFLLLFLKKPTAAVA